MGGITEFSELVARNQLLILEATDAKRRAEALRAKCFELSQTRCGTPGPLNVSFSRAPGRRPGTNLSRPFHDGPRKILSRRDEGSPPLRPLPDDLSPAAAPAPPSGE